MTFGQMCKIEPDLKMLHEEAKAADRSPGHECANRKWYGRGGMKDRMQFYVGWDARDDRLRSCECFDVAYVKIYEALPDCDECSCQGVEAS